MALKAIFAVVTVAVVFVAAPRAHPQTSSDAPHTVSALLAEVRALRHTIETVAAAGAHGQLALGRLQLQEHRLTGAMAKLESMRERLIFTQRQAAEQKEHCATLDASLEDWGTKPRQPYEPDRGQVEDLLKECRRELAVLSADIQRYTAEEAALANEVTMDQSRWLDLNRRLEEIELTLVRRP
jgi:ElaB/YqjD/DUF883 family membrane-anchored ribosome-binding protein